MVVFPCSHLSMDKTTETPTHDQSDTVLAGVWLLHFRKLNLILAEPVFEESWKFTVGIVASSPKAAPDLWPIKRTKRSRPLVMDRS